MLTLVYFCIHSQIHHKFPINLFRSSNSCFSNRISIVLLPSGWCSVTLTRKIMIETIAISLFWFRNPRKCPFILSPTINFPSCDGMMSFTEFEKIQSFRVYSYETYIHTPVRTRSNLCLHFAMHANMRISSKWWSCTQFRVMLSRLGYTRVLPAKWFDVKFSKSWDRIHWISTVYERRTKERWCSLVYLCSKWKPFMQFTKTLSSEIEQNSSEYS